MIQYKKYVSMVTAVTTAMVMTVGFNSYAADGTSESVDAAKQMSVAAIAEWFDWGSERTVNETKEEQKTQEQDQKQNVEKAAEEAEKAAAEKKAKEAEEAAKQEEAEAAAQEAEKKAAEEAAAAQAQQAAAEAAAQQAAEAAAQNAMQVTPDEQALLAALIFCEAGNQPYEGQVAVGAVVMNRVKSGVYPNSISEVIYQPGQFSPAMSGWLDSVLASGGYTETAMQAAADALAGSNPIGDFLYFDCGGVGYQLGDHFFH